MRLAPLLALLLAAPALHAQCRPDPVSPASYYPLGVGDEWIYSLNSEGASFLSRRVLREETVGGTVYAVDRTCRTEGERTTCEPERRVRFDAATATAVERLADGTEGPVFGLRHLNAGFSVLPSDCAVDLGQTVTIGGTAYATARLKGEHAIDFAAPALASGIGPTGSVSLTNPGERSTGFEYAYVGGVQYGFRPRGVASRDPTPAADYYPLEVGNEWIYRYTERSVNGTFDGYVRRRVLRNEATAEQTYAVDQTCTLDALAAAPTWICGPERLIRFDPVTTDVVVREGDRETVRFCRLGADFYAPLPGGCNGVAYEGGGPVALRIGGVDYPSASGKRLLTLANVAPAAFVAGIGPAEAPVGDFRTSSFEFARVRGVEYGMRPVADEPGAAPAAALALLATPNPTAGALRLEITLPDAQTIRLDAVDALGRRVWQTAVALGAGPQSVPVDASAWAPGVYILRAVAGSASASVRVVRR